MTLILQNLGIRTYTDACIGIVLTETESYALKPLFYIVIMTFLDLREQTARSAS